MAGKFLIIPLVLGIVLMGGAMGVSHLQDKTATTAPVGGLATNAGVSAKPSLLQTQPPVDAMAPPALGQQSNESGSLLASIAGFLTSDKQPEAEQEDASQKMVCRTHQGFKRCRFVAQ